MNLPSEQTLVLFTVEQTAEKLQVSRSVIYALIERGKLACHRIGLRRGTIRIAERDLQEYLETCRDGERVEEPKAPRRKKLKHIRL